MAAALALTVAGCGGDNASTAGTDSATMGSTPATPVIEPGDGGTYEPALVPADFVDVVDNPYLPFEPGTEMGLRGRE